MTSPIDEPDKKRQIGGELIVPVLALGFTLYYISTIIDSPWTAQFNAYMIGSVLIALVLLFFGVAAREIIGGRATFGLSNLIEPRNLLAKRVAFVALTTGYFIAMPWVGFTLATFIFLAASMLLLSGGRRPVASLVSAVIMAAIGYGVFIVLFGKRLPRGPVEHLLQGLF